MNRNILTNDEIIKKAKEYLEMKKKPKDCFKPIERIDETVGYIIGSIEEENGEMFIENLIDLLVILCGRNYIHNIPVKEVEDNESK